MKRFGRFIILAVLGFALGAGLAYYQMAKKAELAGVEANPAAETVVEGVAPVDTAAADRAMNAGAADVMASSDTAAAAPAAEAAPAVAGSTVGGAFSLTDHNGNAVTETSWPGKHKLVFFGFTNCPDVCPATLDKLTAALNTLGAETDKLQPLFITTDPERDDTVALKTYLMNYHPSILGLTGTEAQIKEAEDAYKVFASKVPVDETNYTMEHSSYVFLMSPDDKLLDLFKMDDPAQTVADKIRARLAAAPAAAPTAAEDAAQATQEPAKTDEGMTAPAAEETTVPGDMIPEKPEALPEIMPDTAAPAQNGAATDEGAAEEAPAAP